jgi:DNA-binding transcriptional regulator YiaG
MPNLASVLKEEIRRLARKEAKAQVSQLRTASAQYRRDIAALKRQVKAQEKIIARLKKQAGATKPEPAVAADEQQIRFSPAWVRKHRAKLGLSAADYAALVGVSPLTIYNWEKGKSRPQQRQLRAWGAMKSIGKREAWSRLEEL